MLFRSDAELLNKEVGALLGDRERLAAMAAASAALGDRNGAGRIAAEVLRIARKNGK